MNVSLVLYNIIKNIFKECFVMTNLFKNQKYLCALGGAVAVIVGKKIITAKKPVNLLFQDLQRE